MICLLQCMIWMAKTGYPDVCSGKVEIVYSSKHFRYVKLLQSLTPQNNEVKVDIKIWQQVRKQDCR